MLISNKVKAHPPLDEREDFMGHRNIQAFGKPRNRHAQSIVRSDNYDQDMEIPMV
jgi:hypothetical protein